MSVLLIHPPVCQPTEAPPGLAKLAGALKRHAVPHRVLDANLEGLLHILCGEGAVDTGGDNWTKRAFRQRTTHLSTLRTWSTYDHPDRYGRAVRDLSRVLQKTGPAHIHLGLANYEDRTLSPVRSDDLFRAAARPEQNPFFPYFCRRLLSLIEDDSPRIIGFSLNYLSQALCTFAMIGFVRRAAPSVRVIIGGSLVTSWGRRLAGKNPFAGLVDDLITGAGEGPLLGLLGRDGRGSSARPEYADFPLWDYVAPGVVLPYAASRGCYWRRCTFCPERAEGNAYEPMTGPEIREQLGILTKEIRPSVIHFLDNAMSPALLRMLTEDGVGVPWYGFVRLTDLLMDRDFCDHLKKAGCIMLKLGIESGSQTVLDRLQKGIDLHIVSRALTTLKAAGIATYVYLLFGTPPETLEEARETLAFAARHRESIDFLNLAIFNLPVASGGHLETRSFYRGDLSLYEDFSHPQGWNRPQVRHFLDREFRRHPAVAAIVRNDPPVFTSNHAAFFVRSRGDDPEGISRRHPHGRR